MDKDIVEHVKEFAQLGDNELVEYYKGLKEQRTNIELKLALVAIEIDRRINGPKTISEINQANADKIVAREVKNTGRNR